MAKNKTPFRKRTYTLGQIARDASRVTPLLPEALNIWFGGKMDPKFREEIMVAVARANDCRYCNYMHTQWALYEGVPPEELARLSGIDPEHFEHGRFTEKTWLALVYARAVSAGKPAQELVKKAQTVFSRAELRQIETVARVMTIANLTGNTWDALLSRLQGNPAKEGNLTDELAVSGLFWLAAPTAAVYLVAISGKAPLRLLREFRDSSRQLANTPVATR